MLIQKFYKLRNEVLILKKVYNLLNELFIRVFTLLIQVVILLKFFIKLT